MKRVFQLKTLLLSALLCAIGFGCKAQTAAVINNTSCDVVIRFYAIDQITCATLATDAGPYIVGATSAPVMIANTWNPGAPLVNYFVLAEVAYVACGFPGVMVGCGNALCCTPNASMIPCTGCGGTVDNLNSTFPPGGAPGAPYTINVLP